MEKTMREYITGDIHKLIVGVGESKSTYTVGVTNGAINATIAEIVEDKNYLEETGISKHLVICKDEKGFNFLWCEIVGIPHIVQYSRPVAGQAVNNY